MTAADLFHDTVNNGEPEAAADRRSANGFRVLSVSDGMAALG
jgi:hypothetical protein